VDRSRDTGNRPTCSILEQATEDCKASDRRVGSSCPKSRLPNIFTGEVYIVSEIHNCLAPYSTVIVFLCGGGKFLAFLFSFFQKSSSGFKQTHVKFNLSQYSQWIQKKSIFDIKKPFPKQFRGSSEPARLFRALCRASKKDGLNVSHWVDMAEEEQDKRAALGKKIFAVLPQGLNDDEGTSSSSEEDDNSSVSGTHLDNASDVTVGTPSLNSHKRGGKSQSKVSKFMKTGNTEQKKATYMWVTSGSCSEDENPMNGNATTHSHHNANLPEGASG
jgi:hypothetical protein